MEEQKKPWVDGPFQLIKPSKSGAEIGKQLGPARALAAEMSVVHNGLLRGINAVYNQCINVANKGTHQDKVDFANFAAQCAKLLHMHHDHEEEILFPTMGELAGVPGLMDANVAEHAAFHDGFEKYVQYLTSVKEEKEELNGEYLRDLIDAFMPPLHTHLNNEIDSLIALEKWEDKVNWIQWFNSEIEKWNKVLMKQSEFRTQIVPLYLTLHDGGYEGGIWSHFPPMPWLLLIILRFLFMHKNMNWWRFAGCDLYSRPKELPFA